MKFKTLITYIFLSFCLVNNNSVNDIQSCYLCNNTQNNFNQLLENIQEDNPFILLK